MTSAFLNPFGIFAHRGASAVAPESTQAAILDAVRCRADMVELDLQMTADKRIVVFHDERLNRTTNGRGLLSDIPYSTLSRLDAGSWFHPRFADQRVLLASCALGLIPKRVRVNFELKPTSRGSVLIQSLRGLLNRMRAWRRVLISSFDDQMLTQFLPKTCRRALICRRKPDEALKRAIFLNCFAWHPFHNLVTPRRVRIAHEAGLRVHAWTVDDPKRAQTLRQLGVDGVFTNDPLRLRREKS